jgi:hypothetical protein
VDTLSDVDDSSATTASGLLTNKGSDGRISLRETFSVSGSRIVRFTVSGDIVLNSTLSLNSANGNLTLDGSTAPNQGVQVRGRTTELSGSNVIFRYMRFRAGVHSSNPDTVQIIGSNIVLDHCTIMWGDDGDMDIIQGANNVTVQWSLIGHSLGTGASLIKYGTNRISLHHNILAHGITRNPQLANGDAELINNVFYRNWSGKSFGGVTLIAPGGVGDGDGPPPIRVNIIGNYYKPGHLETSSPNSKQIQLYGDRPYSSSSLAYFLGNIGPGRPNDSLSETALVSQDNGTQLFPITSTRITFSNFRAVTSSSAINAYNTVVGSAGTFNVGANLPCSDALDKATIDGVRSGTGTLITSGYPNLNTPCN